MARRNNNGKDDERRTRRNSSGGRNRKQKNYNKKNEENQKNGSSSESSSSYAVTNDYNWYTDNEVVASNSTNWSFMVNRGFPRPVQAGLSTKNLPMATICVVNTNPSIGINPVDPTFGNKFGINAATQAMWNNLAVYTGRVVNYEPSDLGIAMAGLGSIISLIGYIKRVFTAADYVNALNRDFPYALLSAMGIDSTDFYLNRRKYESTFIGLLNKLNAFVKFPENVQYFKLCENQYKYIYGDINAQNSQLYINVPNSVWILDETSSTAGSKLYTSKMFERGTSGNNIQALGVVLDLLEDMIRPWELSATYAYVWTDVLNYAVKTGAKLLEFDAEVKYSESLFVYDELYLDKIRNSQAIGDPATAAATGYTPSNDVLSDPDTGRMLYDPKFTFTTPYIGNDRVLNWKSEPSLAARFDGTRYTVGCTEMTLNGTTSPTWTNEVGCMILPAFYVVCFDLWDNSNPVATIRNVSYNSTAGPVKALVYFGSFSAHPTIYLTNGVPSSTDDKFMIMWQDWDLPCIWNSEDFQLATDLTYASIFSVLAISQEVKR